jgi:hypothetical protein
MHSSLHEGAPIDSRCVFGLNKGGLLRNPAFTTQRSTDDFAQPLPARCGWAFHWGVADSTWDIFAKSVPHYRCIVRIPPGPSGLQRGPNVIFTPVPLAGFFIAAATAATPAFAAGSSVGCTAGGWPSVKD